MKNVIINSFVFIIFSVFINCTKQKTTVELKETQIADTIFQDKIIVYNNYKKLNDTTCLDTYTIKNVKYNYVTKFNVLQWIDPTGYYRPSEIVFNYYDYDELYRCGAVSSTPGIDDQAIYFKVIDNNIIINRIIEKTHPQGINYMHQLCVKRCNVIVKENDTIVWNSFFSKHFRNNDGSPNKYCSDVITDSIEWEENKPR